MADIHGFGSISNNHRLSSAPDLLKKVQSMQTQIDDQRRNAENLTANHKRQIERERKAADTAHSKLRGHEKCEKEINKKQIIINQLKGKISDLEY